MRDKETGRLGFLWYSVNNWPYRHFYTPGFLKPEGYAEPEKEHTAMGHMRDFLHPREAASRRAAGQVPEKDAALSGTTLDAALIGLAEQFPKRAGHVLEAKAGNTTLTIESPLTGTSFYQDAHTTIVNRGSPDEAGDSCGHGRTGRGVSKVAGNLAGTDLEAG